MTNKFTSEEMSKTRLCKNWMHGRCFAKGDCQFAHGAQELQPYPEGYKPRKLSRVRPRRKRKSSGEGDADSSEDINATNNIIPLNHEPVNNNVEMMARNSGGVLFPNGVMTGPSAATQSSMVYNHITQNQSILHHNDMIMQPHHSHNPPMQSQISTYVAAPQMIGTTVNSHMMPIHMGVSTMNQPSYISYPPGPSAPSGTTSTSQPSSNPILQQSTTFSSASAIIPPHMAPPSLGILNSNLDGPAYMSAPPPPPQSSSLATPTDPPSTNSIDFLNMASTPSISLAHQQTFMQTQTPIQTPYITAYLGPNPGDGFSQPQGQSTLISTSNTYYSPNTVHAQPTSSIIPPPPVVPSSISSSTPAEATSTSMVIEAAAAAAVAAAQVAQFAKEAGQEETAAATFSIAATMEHVAAVVAADRQQQAFIMHQQVRELQQQVQQLQQIQYQQQVHIQEQQQQIEHHHITQQMDHLNQHQQQLEQHQLQMDLLHQQVIQQPPQSTQTFVSYNYLPNQPVSSSQFPPQYHHNQMNEPPPHSIQGGNGGSVNVYATSNILTPHPSPSAPNPLNPPHLASLYC
eukprot:GDKJ01036370.1.p1 GENE.GDKJ01036370.1~~GDKJ01036370.1.p1  ORF type:complete len:572 (-),score=138.88 GDKJ01036370.1:2607-4322(-)